MIPLIISVLLQLNWPVPSFPSLPTPTAFVAPTDAPVPTAIFQSSITANLATAQAQANLQATQLAINGDQLYFRGRPVLPRNNNTAQILGYSKWIVSSGSYSLTGPLSPIVIHLGILIFLSLARLLVRFFTLVATVIWKFVWFIIRLVLKIIPFIG